MEKISTKMVLGTAVVVAVVALLVLMTQRPEPYSGPTAPDGTPFRGPSEPPPGADR